MRIPREQALAAMRAEVEQGHALLGASAGIGLSAKSSEAGGADLVVVYNSGRYRMAGRGSAAGLMPYGDANAIVQEMAGEVIPVIDGIPVIAGVCGTDPFRQMPIFLEELRRLGYSGVQNFPTVGLIEGALRQTLEETGMGYGLEVELIRTAHELGMLTVPYVFDDDQARAMAEAGADVLVPHMGTTAKGAIGARTTVDMEDSAARIASMARVALEINPEILVLCHGGPIAEPPDAAEIMRLVPEVVGFLGASSTERLPVERAIADTVRAFKAIRVGQEARS